MQRAAYYYPATKAQKAKGISGKLDLYTIENGERRAIATNQPCASAAIARKAAKAHGATPWNF